MSNKEVGRCDGVIQRSRPRRVACSSCGRAAESLSFTMAFGASTARHLPGLIVQLRDSGITEATIAACFFVCLFLSFVVSARVSAKVSAPGVSSNPQIAAAKKGIVPTLPGASSPALSSVKGSVYTEGALRAQWPGKARACAFLWQTA